MHQIQRSRTQQQKLAVALSGLAVVVDDAAQDIEHARGTVDFVEDDQLPALGAQVSVGIVKAEPVGWAFEIKINRAVRPTGSDMQRQRGLSYLTRPKQYDSGGMSQRLANGCFGLAINPSAPAPG